MNKRSLSLSKLFYCLFSADLFSCINYFVEKAAKLIFIGLSGVFCFVLTQIQEIIFTEKGNYSKSHNCLTWEQKIMLLSGFMSFKFQISPDFYLNLTREPRVLPHRVLYSRHNGTYHTDPFV